MKPTIDHRPIRAGAFGHLPTRRPCVECPLRRDAKAGALGGYTVQQYLDVLHSPADLACHLSPGFPTLIAEQRSCTGVAMYRANTGIKPWGHAAAAVAHVGADRDAVFASPAEFARHHKVASE